MYLLVVDPGRPQRLLELGEAHDVNVDELDHLVALGGAAGLVPHDLAHDPGVESVELKSTFSSIQVCKKINVGYLFLHSISLNMVSFSSKRLVVKQ